MNNEIKEILDRLDYEEWEVDLYKTPITWCEMYNIRDYITNLQESEAYYYGQYKDYKSRNEKAIERLKKIQENAIKYGADHDAIICQDLLNILQGSDEDEKTME